MALSLTEMGLGGGSRKLGPWLLDRGRAARPDGDPLSSQTGPGSPALPPTPPPGRLCLNKLSACCCMETGAGSCSRVTWLPSSALFVSA